MLGTKQKPQTTAATYTPPEMVNPPHGVVVQTLIDLIDQLHRWFLPTADFNTIALTNVPLGIFTEHGEITGMQFYNPNTAVCFVKLYDRHDAPAIGSVDPDETIAVPAASSLPVTPGSRGVFFSTGCWIAATVNAANADNTAPTTALLALIFYKAV